MSVGDHCHGDVVTAKANESAREAAHRMRDRDVGCLVVVDDEGAPIGMLTDRDLVQRVLRRGRDAETTRIEDVMNDELVTVGAHKSLSRALARMRQEAVRRVVVVDSEGAMKGILTQDDILPIVARELDLAAQVVRLQLAADPAPARA